MKKSLVLAMAMAMGVTASAYAANPFSDVPSGHWAYDAVAKLADAGVVDGYGATFGGDKLMTRYEMAQVVAKAMANGANVDKLAAEFAEELDSLGVRVAKLEKKVDNVKITGAIRMDYKSHDGKGTDANASDSNGYGYAVLRSRIFIDGQINKNWSYTGMLQQEHNIHDNDEHNGKGYGDGEAIALKRAYLDGRLGGVKVRAGHWNEFFVNDTILDDFVDGVFAEYGLGKGRVYGLAGKGLKYSTFGNVEDGDRLYVAGVEQKFGPVNLGFNYFRTEGTYDRAIYNFNADVNFMKEFNATVRYMWTDDEVVPSQNSEGWYGQLNYKGADPAVADTWGLRARYFDQPANVYLNPTYDCNTFNKNGGYEGWGFGGDLTFAKNIMLQVDYYDIESKDDKLSDRTWYSQLWFFF